MARITGASTHDDESLASLSLLTLHLLWMVVPALLLGYKIKARQHLVSLSLLRALDIHASAAAKSSHPGSCEHGNREGRPPKPVPFVSSSARVKTDNQVFWSVFTRLLARSFFFLLLLDGLG